MKKRLAALVFGLTFSVAVIHDASLYFHYLLNQEEITELFCINKAEPELQCNGKCHLKKQLRATPEKEQNEAVSFEFNQLFLVMPFEASDSGVICGFAEGSAFPDFNRFETDPHLMSETPPPRRSA